MMLDSDILYYNSLVLQEKKRCFTTGNVIFSIVRNKTRDEEMREEWGKYFEEKFVPQFIKNIF